MTVGCSPGGFSKRSQDARGGAFTYALAVSPTTLDPAMVQDIDTGDLLQQVFEGLVSYDEGNRIVGGLADSWQLSDDGRIYTFKLKAARFQDGSPVTAEDVRATFERNLAPKFNSPTAINYLSDIVGAVEYNSGKAKSITGIQVVDAQTVTISIDKPRPYFLGKLTYACAYILPKSVGPTQIDTVARAVGSGPFRIKNFQVDQQVDLEAFADYHEGAPKLTEMRRPIIQDAATRLNKYRTGELDMLGIQRQEITAIRNDPNLAKDLRFAPRPAVFYIGLSQLAYPPFKDKRIREAIALCVDRKRIDGELLGGLPEAHGMLPLHVMGYRDNLAGLPYDPARAKQLLAEAGHPGGKGLPPLRIVYKAQTPDSQTAVEAIATSVRQATGWEVKPTALEWSALLASRNKRELQAYMLSWYGDYLDPQNFLSFLFQSDSPQNRDGYDNAEFDRLTRLADVERDERKRLELYAKAEDILVQDVARIPLYFGQDAILVSPRVQGIRTNLFGNMPHTQVVVQ